MNKSRVTWLVLIAALVCIQVYRNYAHAIRADNAESKTPVQTSVYYEGPAFSVVYPPGSVVQLQHTTSEDTPPLVWTYYQGIMPNDARLVVSYADFDAQRAPIELSKQIDDSDDNIFVPGYSIKKEASRLDTLPAVSAVVYGFAQGSDTVQCHKCTRYESRVVIAWDKDRRRLWMLQTLGEPNELSSDEAVKFFNSFKLK